MPRAILILNVFLHSAPSFLSTALDFTLARVLFLFPIFLGSLHDHDLVLSNVVKIRLVYKLGHPNVDCYVKYDGVGGLCLLLLYVCLFIYLYIYFFIALEVSGVPRRLPELCGM